MILPALLVAIGYGGLWQYVLPAKKALADARTRLANAQARAPSPEALDLSLRQLALLRQDIDNQERDKHQLQGQWQALAARHGGAGGRAQAGARLTELLSRHHLVLLHEGPADAGSKGGKPPEALRKVAAQLAPAAAGGMHLWRVQMVGRFSQVLAVLEELSAEESIAMPVSLSMDEARPGTDARSWVLVVWI
jgi:hypothetical protein